MKKTYHATLFIPDLTKAVFELEICDKVKYEATTEDFVTVTYTGVKTYDIIEGGKEAEAIERYGDLMDEHHEYLVLHFADGHTATYRNSHVVMFITKGEV